ncbi:MAG TPA: M3 family metallopeptidase, partial [Luteimonas sp.]|nr:M3 family metallopeptidase [Luteimonas sp.]
MTMRHPLALALATLLAAAPFHAQAQDASPVSVPAPGATAPQAQENPFFHESPLPLHYPQFDRIQDSDFAPAFDRGMADELAEIDAIANNPEAPTFENTVVALQKTGKILERAQQVFYNLVGADTNDTREALRAEYAPKFSAHRDAIVLNPKLFARIQAVYDGLDASGLQGEDRRLVEKYYENFVRAGAKLPDADKARLKAINAELAQLGTKFSQNVLAEVNASAVVVDSREELAGLPEADIEAAAAAAKKRGLDGKYVIALQNTTGQPPNTYLENRALRKRIHEASIARGSRGNEFDNTGLVSQIMKLRLERAKLLGYDDYASFVLDDETAKTPEAVNAMLSRLAPAAVANAKKEAADLQAMIDKEQAARGEPSFKLEPWDWAYYTEKVRQAKYAFDESQLKPYLELDNVQQNGVFYAANQVYGLTFKERHDLPVYHDDVRVFDVFDRDGKQLAIFISDMYARPSKRGGAWMNSYVDQSAMTGNLPVVANHLNIPKPADGEPTFKLQPWDWAYYAEKLRQQKYDFDESQLKPYFELDNVQQNGVFYAANQL